MVDISVPVPCPEVVCMLPYLFLHAVSQQRVPVGVNLGLDLNSDGIEGFKKAGQMLCISWTEECMLPKASS